MSVSNIIQLRQLLREKFPGLRTRADELSVRPRAGWPTGVSELDERLGGGFCKGALTEIVSSGPTAGAASLIAQIIRQTAATRQFIALVDGAGSFDPAPFDPAMLARLLWVRCRNGGEALKAGDLVFRDGNIPVVLLDLGLLPEAELRKIPAPAWYRFQRIVEERGIVSVVFTPRSMVSPAQSRVTLHSRFDLGALDRDAEVLLSGIEFEVFEPRRGLDDAAALRRSA